MADRCKRSTSKVAKAATLIARMLDDGASRKAILKGLQSKRVGLTEHGAATYYYNLTTR